MKSALLLLLSTLFLLPSFSQTDERENQQNYSIHIKASPSTIILDGILEEEAWQTAEIATDFWQKQPRDDVKAGLRTEMKLTYDDNFLYVGAVCFDSINHVISTLKRDVGFWDGDAVGVTLDPLNEATTGFMFGTNPYGVQTEVLLGGGSGEENYNSQWDNRWYVETQRYDDKWTVEMAIPFKTLRFESGKTVWGINFHRNDKKNNRLDAWARVPIQFWVIDLGYTGRLIWDHAPEKSKGNISIIPYINGSSLQDFEAGEEADNSLNVGLDAKVALSSSLNLDLTVNPDFSQVEVDQQITNLTRFNIFLPERRTFFLENSDIFTKVGFPVIQPFFSRRIGLDEDGRTVPIAFGARLTGNVTGTSRIGVMNVQTRETDDLAAQNYTAASFTQRLFKRSQISGLFTNRQSFTGGEINSDDYGRNASLKFNYLNQDGSFEVWTSAHKSFKQGIKGDDMYFENGISYQGKKFSALLDYTYVGNDYYADMGFINLIDNYDAERDTTIRLGYQFFFFPITFNFFPKNSKVLNQHSVQLESFVNMDTGGGLLERSNELLYSFEFRNSSQLDLSLANSNEDVRFPFTFTDATPVPAGRYTYTRGQIEYNSDERKLFQYQLSLASGGFYNGNLHSLNLGLLYRIQPWGNFGMIIEYNDLNFPDPYGSTTLWAFSPRIEINFNRNLFWTTFLQYNTQADNFNINSRFQWRFAPMSDLFLVYTDNYAIENFGVKNRAIVMKLNYWLVI